MTETHADQIASAHRSPWRWAQRGLWFFMALTVLAGLPWAYLHVSTVVRLQRVLRETDQQDPHWRLADLIADRPAVPDAENAALRVEAVAKALGPDWLPRRDYEQSRTIDPHRLNPILDLLHKSEPNEVLPIEEARHLDGELAAVRTLLLEARGLAEMPRARPHLTIAGLFSD